MATAEMKLKLKYDIDDPCHMLLLLKMIKRSSGVTYFRRYRTWLEEEIGLPVPKWLEELCEEVWDD